MKLESIFIKFMAVFISVAFLYIFMKSDAKVTGNTHVGIQTSGNLLLFEPKTTGSTGAGDALVELTPSFIDKDRLVVKYTINTHSVNLSSFDISQIATLEYGGNVLKPTKASKLSGHHPSGTLAFNTEEDIGIFTIKIKGLPNINERVYKWNAG